MSNFSELYIDYTLGRKKDLTEAQKAILDTYSDMLDKVDEMDELLIITEHLEMAYNEIEALDKIRIAELKIKIRSITEEG